MLAFAAALTFTLDVFTTVGLARWRQLLSGVLSPWVKIDAFFMSATRPISPQSRLK